MRVFNLFDGEMTVDADDPERYRASYAKLRDHIAAELLGGTAVVLEVDEAVCPYHYELIEEEWLLVLEGVASVRTPSGVYEVGAGEVVCFPRGPSGAHQIFNAAAEPARILIVSERAEMAASVYEDSDKVGVFGPGMRHLFRRSDDRDYYDGEPGV